MAKTEPSQQTWMQPYQDALRSFEQAVHDLERRADRALRDAFERGIEWNDLNLGVRLGRGVDGRPLADVFGHLEEALGAAWRKPLLSAEYDEDAGALVVRMELPGVPKNAINVEVGQEDVKVTAEGGHQKYRAAYVPGVGLDPNHAHAECKDGVLTIRVGGAMEPKRQTRTVPVD